ncbi:hypothetical protein Lal_00001018 [Lupinus albus]|nr:hypothetical protein Lal_00001018 [Lupinus albus]
MVTTPTNSFWSGIVCQVGDDFTTRFWLDICDVGRWVDGNWEWILPWRHPFFAWESELNDSFLNELHSILLQKSKSPLKVITFAWRLFQDKIPSKVALQRREIPLSMGGAHLQLDGYQCRLPSSLIHHFICHMGMVKDKKRWSLWSMFWFATMWAIWLYRNELIFNQVESSPNGIFESAMVKS